jgi:peptidoglycan/LPS O-acetylase OafA/YrhL
VNAEKRRDYIPQLDGLRAVAVLLVVTFHTSPAFAWLHGWRGVTIFFVLSGYLITSLALAEESQRGGLSFLGFYIRRTFRILPLYYLVLLVYCVMILGLGLSPKNHRGLTTALPYYLAYLQEVPLALRGGPEGLPFNQSWSLGIEEKFYLFWPVVAFGVLARARHLRPWVAGALIVGFASFRWFGSPLISDLFSHYYHILTGCLLAILKPQSLAGRRPLTYPLLVLVLLCQLAVPQLSLPHWASELNHLAYTAGVALLLAALLTETTRVRSLLAWRPLAFVGKISYGIYLVHLLCLHAAETVTSNPVVSLVLTSALSIAVATVLHWTIEKPLIGVGRRFSRRVLARSLPVVELAAPQS